MHASAATRDAAEALACHCYEILLTPRSASCMKILLKLLDLK